MKKLERVILEDIVSGEAICRSFTTLNDPRGDDREVNIIYKDGSEVNIQMLSEDFAREIVEGFMKAMK